MMGLATRLPFVMDDRGTTGPDLSFRLGQDYAAPPAIPEAQVMIISGSFDSGGGMILTRSCGSYLLPKVLKTDRIGDSVNGVSLDWIRHSGSSERCFSLRHDAGTFRIGLRVEYKSTRWQWILPAEVWVVCGKSSYIHNRTYLIQKQGEPIQVPGYML